MNIKQLLLSLAVVLALMVVTIAARADTWLIIPAQYWSNEHGSMYRPTIVHLFKDSPYEPYPSAFRCAYAAKRLHNAEYLAPHYSMCTSNSPSIGRWK